MATAIGFIAAARTLELACIPLLLVYHRLVYDLTGALLDRQGVDHAALLVTPLDGRIPYVAVFVLPYVFTWGYAFAVAAYAAWAGTFDRILFRYIYLSSLAMSALEGAIWLGFPARISVRASTEVLAQAGWLGDLTSIVYAHATPWNVFPSAHVAFAYASWLLSRHFALPGHRWIFGVAALTIAASTLFVRNHFVLDLAGSVLVAEVAYRFVFLPARRARLLDGWSSSAMIGLCAFAALAMITLRFSMGPSG